MIIDTHVHFLIEQFDEDRGDVIKRCRECGVEIFIEVGFDEENSLAAFEFVKDHKGFFCAVGIHPHSAVEITDEALDRLKKIAEHDKVVAWGEIGLDYFRNLSPSEDQIIGFKKQIACARAVKLPLIVHCRDAHPDMKKILKEESTNDKYKGVIHSFSGDSNDAEFYISLGFVIGIGGPLTYKSNDRLHDVVKKTPLDKIILETDAPYLPPTPHRGERNESGYLTFVTQKIAELKGIDEKLVQDTTTETARKLFGIYDEN